MSLSQISTAVGTRNKTKVIILVQKISFTHNQKLCATDILDDTNPSNIQQPFMSCETCHVSSVTCQVSGVTCQVSHATCNSQTVRARQLKFLEKVYPPPSVACQMSNVKMSRVTCNVSLVTGNVYLSRVMCHVSPFPKRHKFKFF